jgi:hypothetical protein
VDASLIATMAQLMDQAITGRRPDSFPHALTNNKHSNDWWPSPMRTRPCPLSDADRDNTWPGCSISPAVTTCAS